MTTKDVMFTIFGIVYIIRRLSSSKLKMRSDRNRRVKPCILRQKN